MGTDNQFAAGVGVMLARSSIAARGVGRTKLGIIVMVRGFLPASMVTIASRRPRVPQLGIGRINVASKNAMVQNVTRSARPNVASSARATTKVQDPNVRPKGRSGKVQIVRENAIRHLVIASVESDATRTVCAMHLRRSAMSK